MTITRGGLAGGNHAENATSVSRALGTVSAGQLAVVGSSKYAPSASAYASGNCTLSAGTATLAAAFVLDRGDGGATGTGGPYAYSGIWSAIVATGGTATVQVSGSPAGSYLLISAEAYNGSWDASRVEAANGALNTGDTQASASTGNVSTVGAALLFAVLGINDNQAQTINEDGAGGWSLVYEDQAVTDALGSMVDRLVGGAGTYSHTWTFTALDGSGGNGTATSIVAYKEAAAAAATSLPPRRRSIAPLLHF